MAERVVVVGVDGSSESMDAVVWASREALRRGCRLRIVNAWHPHAYAVSPFFVVAVPEAMGEPEETARTNAEKACELAQRVVPRLDVQLRTPCGPSARTLLEHAADAQVLVIGGKHRSALDRAVFGSVTTHAVTHAPCPVVVVRAQAADSGRAVEGRGPVVLGFDGSDGARTAAVFAFEYAEDHGLDVSVVLAVNHALRDDLAGGDQMLELNPQCLADSMSDFAGKYPTVVMTATTAVGYPASVLLDHAQRAELLVVGSRGRGWFEGMLLGSVSGALVHHAPVTLAVVHERNASADLG